MAGTSTRSKILPKEFGVAAGSEHLKISLMNEFRIARSEVLLKKCEMAMGHVRDGRDFDSLENIADGVRGSRGFGALEDIVDEGVRDSGGFNVFEYIRRTSSGLPRLLCVQKYHS